MFKQPKGVGVKILIIDDEKDICEYLKELLEGEGYEVVTALSVKEGLDHQLNTEFDLMIMDLQLPEIGGKEIIDLARARRPNLPIIILSGHVDSVDELMGLGATCVLHKPIEMNSILETIQKHSPK